MSPGGRSAIVGSARYTYAAVPTVSALSPAAAPPAGGTVVTVTGTDLGSASAVMFGPVPGTDLVLISPTELIVTAPAQSVEGPVDVQS